MITSTVQTALIQTPSTWAPANSLGPRPGLDTPLLSVGISVHLTVKHIIYISMHRLCQEMQSMYILPM